MENRVFHRTPSRNFKENPVDYVSPYTLNTLQIMEHPSHHKHPVDYGAPSTSWNTQYLLHGTPCRLWNTVQIMEHHIHH